MQQQKIILRSIKIKIIENYLGCYFERNSNSFNRKMRIKIMLKNTYIEAINKTWCEL